LGAGGGRRLAPDRGGAPPAQRCRVRHRPGDLRRLRGHARRGWDQLSRAGRAAAPGLPRLPPPGGQHLPDHRPLGRPGPGAAARLRHPVRRPARRRPARLARAARGPDTPMSAVIRARDLVIEYATDRGPIRALDGADLAVEAGESVGIVGESGSGKTTLGLAIGRLLAPNARVLSGDLAVLDEPVL